MLRLRVDCSTMKKYARLRQDCSEFDNALYNASPERTSGAEFFHSESRPVAVSSDGSASPQRDSPPALRLARPSQQPAPTTNGPSHTDLTEALKKLASYREGTSRQQTEPWQQVGEQSASGRWPVNSHDPEWDPRDPSGSGRWQTAETASLSGRWGSVSTTDHWDDLAHSQGTNSFRDSLSLSRSGRLMQEGEPWTATTASTAVPISQPLQRNSSLREAPGRMLIARTSTTEPRTNTNEHLGAAVQRNISMRETQGWLAAVKRPSQQPHRKSNNNAWEDPNEFNWRAATSSTSNNNANASSRKERPPVASVSQSMRYDRLRGSDLGHDEEGNNNHHHNHSQSVMQKAASMREGGAHSDAIMAMARAYSEKHGVQQAILECVACGRALGVIVQGNPGNDTSFCQSCRPHAVGGWTYHTKAPDSGKPKRKGMMHFCKRILRMGKKPHKLKP